MRKWFNLLALKGRTLNYTSCVIGFLLCSILPNTATAVVILQYHHVSDTTPKRTSVTPAQFAEQMQYLADNDYQVISLTDAVTDIKNQQEEESKQVVITFDDGYDSIFTQAAPILAKHQFPYTVFLSVDPIDAGYEGMMTWEQVKQLSDQGVIIANHTKGHEHLIRQLDNETISQWRQRVKQNLLDTEQRINQQTGQSVMLLAYPYGEYHTQLEALVAELGFVAFGQQSGAAGKYSSLTALPRFPIADAYADLQSLRVKFSSLNMPVLKQNITDPLLAFGQWQPQLKLTIDTQDIYPHQVMCFIQGQGSQQPAWINENTFTIQATTALNPGRTRYNCTAPSKSKGDYYWFSQPWIRTKDDGTWVEE
ncbi:polysaccharide deacetylase family protein [Shewanella aestuarii]|uniref:Polysaccharide deacetylase family protein n=1 Tax=Shewanella aestuarii TaxID=1028752 RepID=A0A6G9QH88_9GAMM|nr:polysaccharide deacetylase family protein [Shewanella aestuarii]QIR13239.1 polysaccharide deacetylase family protein [Shewanella aestuarii]